MNDRKLLLSADKKLAGVCGGIADYFGVDPTVVRVAYVLLTLCTAFCGVLAYLILWAIIPSSDNRI